EGLVQKLVGGRRAQQRAQIGRILLAKAHVKRSGAGHPHAIAAFAKIMGEGGDEAQTAPGFRDVHITGGAACPIAGWAKSEALLEPRLDQVQWQKLICTPGLDLAERHDLDLSEVSPPRVR